MDFYLLKGILSQAKRRSLQYARANLHSVRTWDCEVTYTFLFDAFEHSDYDNRPYLAELGAVFVDRSKFTSIYNYITITNETRWKLYTLRYFSDARIYGISYENSLLLNEEIDYDRLIGGIGSRRLCFFWNLAESYSDNLGRLRSFSAVQTQQVFPASF